MIIFAAKYNYETFFIFDIQCFVDNSWNCSKEDGFSPV